MSEITLDLTLPTRDLVNQAATALLSNGTKPTVSNVLALIGKGSATTINSALNGWWQDLGKRVSGLHRHSALPDHVAEQANVLWLVALKEAEGALAIYRQEVDGKITEIQSGVAKAQADLQAAEEARQSALAELDAANATIDGLERTISAEVAHKNSLSNEVASLHEMLGGVRQDAEKARQEAAAEMEKAREEYQKQLSLAQERFESVQKKMLIEIDNERQAAAALRQDFDLEKRSLKADAELAGERMRQRAAETAARLSALSSDVARLEGQLAEVTVQRDHLNSLLASAVVTQKRRGRVDVESKKQKARRMLR